MEQEIEGKRRKRGGSAAFFRRRAEKKKPDLPCRRHWNAEIFESALYQYVWCPGIFSGRAKGNAIHFSSGTAEWILAAENGKAEESLQSLACIYGKISILAPVAHYKDLLDFSLQEIESMMGGSAETILV